MPDSFLTDSEGDNSTTVIDPAQFINPGDGEKGFKAEDLQNAQELRNTPYLSAIWQDIQNSTVSNRCKRTLVRILLTHFTQDNVLANYPNLIDPRITLDLDLIMAKQGMWPDDLKNPDTINILQSIYSHQDPWISRGIGPNRERIQQSRTIQTHEVSQRTDHLFIPNEPNNRKKRLFK